jgi:hypothetical protein
MLAALIAFNADNDLLSDNLSLVFVGLFVMVGTTALLDGSRKRDVWPQLGLAACTALLLTTRNANVAYVPGALAVAFFARRNAPPHGGGMRSIVIPLVAGTAAWFFVRGWLNQLESHRLSLGGRYSPYEYLKQTAVDVVAHFSVPVPLGSVIAVVYVLVALAYYSRIHADTRSTTLWTIRALALFFGVSFVCLFLLFNLTDIFDPLNGRFLVPFYIGAAIIVSLLCSATTRPRFSAVSACLAALPALVAVMALTRSIARPTEPVNVLPHFTIDSSYLRGEPVPSGRYLLVAPPSFPWMTRSERIRAGGR